VIHRLLLIAAIAQASSGCGTRLDDEAVGDLAVAEGRWAEAVEAYGRAGREPVVLAKRASAALEAGRPGAAALAWTELAERDSSRTGEAAVGLARSALMAQRDGDMLSLANAVRGLRTVAPGWPLGRLALPLRLAAFPSDEDVIMLAPAILAAAPSRDVADEVLGALAGAWRERDRCDRAAPILDALSRRLVGVAASTAASGYAACRLRTGLQAIEAGDWVAARGPLSEAVNRDPDGATGRRALVALGDVHFQMGDVFAAQLAWRTAASAALETDSITALALDRLRAAQATDSTGVPETMP
jgi:hypothetical protein